MRITVCRLAVAVCGFSVLAQGQAGGTAGANIMATNGAVVRGAMGFSGQAMFHGTPVTGAPFSAQRVSEHVLVVADGTRFTTNNQQETIYRDSQGRVRTERAVMIGPTPTANQPVVIEIQDPIGNVSYTLDAQNKVAHRVAWQTPESRAAAAGPAVAARSGQWFQSTSGAAGTMSAVLPAPPPPGGGTLSALLTSPRPSSMAAPAVAGARRTDPEVTSEDLGQQAIEGVMAEGHRTVQTWPAGAMGNDRPFQVMSENWYSPEIQEMVLSRNSDPRTGENTMKLTNVNRAEPSAALFLPPADYTIADETGPFQVQWTGVKQ